MMARCLCAVILAFMGVNAVAADPIAVSPQEAHDWLLHVIPLPKQVTLEAKLAVPASGVSIMVPPVLPNRHLVEAESLGRELLERSGAEALPAPGAADLLIIAGVLDEQGAVAGRRVEGAGQLKGLKNSDQAYLIRPLDEKTLVVTGLDPRGVFYGLKTLWQLMEPTFEGEGERLARGTPAKQASGEQCTVEVPLGTILDWPDLAERGEWGGSVNRDIEWLANRKMNLCESHCKSLKVTEEGKGVAEFDKTLIERGAACAVKVVPIITHLDQLQGTGLFDVFPHTLGVGDPKTWPYGGTTVKPACFSKPETARVLADWMVSLAEQPEITDINIWLSEHHVACECEQCKQKGQFVLEAEAIARGYELALQARPDIKLRVLLTQGSYEFNDQVVAALPREIGVTYYDGGRTYDSSRNEMIYDLLEQYAADGGWLGCYPQLTASWRIVCPWSGPQFIKFRMTEFVADGLECLCGYATPDNRFYDFNVNAAAEWSWNAHGRDEREFALAYFTKQGVADPDKAADWAVLLGPVGWDVYGARVPYNWLFGAAAQSLSSGSVPALGSGPYRHMPDEDHIAKSLETCAEAMTLAQELAQPELIAETRVVEGYVKMLKTIHELGQVIGKKTDLAAAERQAAAELMAALDQATNQTTEGLLAWQQAVAPDYAGGRFADTVQVTEQTCADIGRALARFGIEDPGRAYRMNRAGAWQTPDFDGGPRITGQWEVTDLLDGPGAYKLQFVYRRGWYGLHIYKASLASAPKDSPETLTPVATDEHEGTAAHVNKDNVYQFELATHDPNLRYFVVADIGGCPKESPPDKQGCEGEVFFWKQRPE